MPERMECRATPARTLGLIALAVVMTAGSVLVTLMGSPIPVIFGCLGTVLFGYCLARLLVDARRGGPRIVISDLGIEDRRGGLGLIRWEDIVAVRIRSQGPNRFMCIDVEDPQSYLAALPWHTRWIAKANGALGFSPITLNFAALRPGLDEAMAFICDRYNVAADDSES